MRSYSYKSISDEAKPRANCLIFCVIASSFCSFFCIIFVLVAFPYVFQQLVYSKVALVNGTIDYEQWLNPTPKIYKIVTVYNITNQDEVYNGKAPNITAIGPYYFREYREKINVETNNDELRYNERKYYIFDDYATMEANVHTNVTLDPDKDRFVTVNLAWVGVVYNQTLSNCGPGKKLLIELAADGLFHDSRMFINKTVNEIIFGYKDKLLEALKLVIPSLPDTVRCVYNMSSNDINKQSIINSGKKNHSKLGSFSKWQGYTQLPYWGSDEANTLNGTEGLFFAPGLQKNETVTTFVDDLFRANPMEYIGVEDVLGITSYKYQIPDYVLMNATQNPLNAGFYSFAPSGMMNLTAAVNAPVMASKPSFLDADAWLHEEVNGLPAPDKDSMDTNIWIEPTTGVLTKAMKQLQVNIMVQQQNWTHLQNLRVAPRFIPIAKIVETGGVDEGLANTIKHKVFKPRSIFENVLYSLFGLFTLVTLILIIVLGQHVLKNQSEVTRPLIAENDSKNVNSRE